MPDKNLLTVRKAVESDDEDGTHNDLVPRHLLGHEGIQNIRPVFSREDLSRHGDTSSIMDLSQQFSITNSAAYTHLVHPKVTDIEVGKVHADVCIIRDGLPE